MSHFHRHFLSLAAACSVAVALPAQRFPLSENSWSNPEFVQRFLGTYGFNTDLNPSISREERTLFEEVQPLIASNPRAAVQRLRAAIKPDSSAALDQVLGNLLYQDNDLAGAAAAYREAIRKFPNFYRAYQNLGRVLVTQGDYAAALPIITKAIELGGGDGSLYGLLGYSYMNLGRNATALDAYRQAILLQPDSLDWRKGKLSCLLQLGRYDEAIGLLYEFIEREPGNPEFWQWQANAFMSAERYDLAAANLEVLRLLGAATPASLLLLGDLYVNKDLPSLAVPLYEEALATGRLNSRQAFRAAEALLSRGELEAGARFLAGFERLAGGSLSPEDRLALLNHQARIALQTGDDTAAQNLLQGIIDADPLNGRALLTLSDLHLRSGDTAAAAFHAEQAAKLDAHRADALVRLARIEVQNRNYRRAAQHLRAVQEIRPQPYIAEFLGRVEQAAARM
jgi:tetratricopeptide (TPR) repeat protein